jgi:site-specific DNA-methyltransferase (adenine-specific)
MDAALKSPLSDGAPSAFHPAPCSPAPYYEADGITLYHGDMREILPHLQPVDAVVTDPPYNETSLEWDVWPDGWPTLLQPLARSMWCFGSLRMFWDRVGEFDGWKLAQDIVWEKQNGSGFADDRFKRVHELAIHLYRGEWASLHKSPPLVAGKPQRYTRHAQPPHTGTIGGHTSRELRTERIQRSVIFAKNCHGYAVNETQKPEAIVAPLLEYCVPPGGIVLDCFAGSGTVLAVARSQGKRAIGIERRESQCREIVNRLSQRELSLGNDDVSHRDRERQPVADQPSNQP